MWRAAFAVVLLAAAAHAQTEWIDRLDRALTVGTPGGAARAELSGLFDLEGYYIDRHAPGLIFGGGSGLVNPRLSLFLDAWAGRHFYGFVQTRFDSGFDPRSPDPSIRLDEYLLRYSPFAGPQLAVQAGKFATVVGNWVPRHFSWENPFITAPLPYENVTIVSDTGIAGGPGAFIERRNLPDRKRLWLPIIWGPDYASGLALFGHVARFDYAAEVKNAPLGARPKTWSPRYRGWNEPTASGRLGWRPAAPWAFGTSFSSGPYLDADTEAALPAGKGLDDFREWLIGADMSFARRHLEVWAEFFAVRFEVPNVGDVDTAAWYIEGRYKLTQRLFAALRWNQQIFGDIDTPSGRERPWDRDGWRIDSALTWRQDRHLQGKLQYGYFHQAGHLQQGEQQVAAQVTVKF